jgi:hypothetical protein
MPYIRCHLLCPICAIIAARDWCADRLTLLCAGTAAHLGLLDEGMGEP